MADRMATFKYARNKGCTIPDTFLDSELVTYGDVKNNNTVKIENASRYSDKRCVREMDLSMQDVDASITLGYTTSDFTSGATNNETLTYTIKNVSDITVESSNKDWLTIVSYDNSKCLYKLSLNTGKSSRSATITVKGKNSVTGDEVKSSCVISQNGASYTYILTFKRNDGGNLNYENKVTIDGNVNTFAASANSYTFTAATNSVTISSSANYFTNNYSTSTSINYGNTTIEYTPITYYFYVKIVDENGNRITDSEFTVDYEYTNLVDGGKQEGKWSAIKNGYIKHTRTGTTSTTFQVTATTNTAYIVPSSSVTVSGKSTEPTSYTEITLKKQSLDVTYKVKLNVDVYFNVSANDSGTLRANPFVEMWLMDTGSTKESNIYGDYLANEASTYLDGDNPAYGYFHGALGRAIECEIDLPPGTNSVYLYILVRDYGWVLNNNNKMFSVNTSNTSRVKINGAYTTFEGTSAGEYKAKINVQQGSNDIQAIELGGWLS